MSAEICGVSLDQLGGHVWWALHTYSGMTYDYERGKKRLALEPDAASKLELTPALSNAARSVSRALFDGEQVGNLVVIAFAPGQGSGKMHIPDGFQVAEGLPRSKVIMPRNKSTEGTDTEVAISLFEQGIDDEDAVARDYGGTLHLISRVGNTLQSIGLLGHSTADQSPYDSSRPTTTYTVYNASNGERPGNLHAVYNRLEDRKLRVFGFLALDTQATQAHPDLFQLLHARPPLPPEPLAA